MLKIILTNKETYSMELFEKYGDTIDFIVT